jgi:CRISPR system Cascade subunit CasB
MLGRIVTRPDALAALRRGVGRSLEEAPDSWSYVMQVAGSHRYREEPAHVALGLFALHRQSQRTETEGVGGRAFGQACSELKRSRGAQGGSEEGIDRRFKSALASDSLDSLAVHLRSLVTMLRAADIDVDYALLFEDLVRWQRHGERDKVCLRWARQYFSVQEVA